MKILTILLLLILGTFSWAQNSSDVPPPPMPDYMKKHNFKSPPPPPPKTKLQSPAMVQPEKKETKKVTKFLNESKPQPKIFQKTSSIKEDVDKTLIENQEDDEASLEPETEITEAPKYDDSENETNEVMEQTLERVNSKYLQDTENENTAELQEANGKNSAQANEKLAEVEDMLESQEQDHEKLLNNRIVAGTQKFKAGMYKFNSDCSMHVDASSISDKAGKIKAGQKLWIDSHDTNWHKVYKKSGAVYISADCLNQ
jgi:hypothetical protein